MFLTQKHLSRRTVLRGVGATIALPFLDSMIPARSVLAKTAAARAASRARLVCIEQVHGAAGCSEYGLAQNLWSPAATGRRFDISKGNLSPLEPFRDQLTIISNTDARMAEAQSAPEVGGDHFRSSAVMYTQAHPKLTEGSDVRVGISMDQLYAQKFGQDTPIPSMQLTHRAGRSVRRLRLRLRVRLHRHDQLGGSGPAAADGARPAHGVRAVVRLGRHAGAARPAACDRPQHPRHVDRARWPTCGDRWARRTGSVWISTRATSGRSSSASHASKPATRAARRASCPVRRPACRMRSTNTSS